MSNHTEHVCEACDYTVKFDENGKRLNDGLVRYRDMHLCPSCLKREIQTVSENKNNGPATPGDAARQDIIFAQSRPTRNTSEKIEALLKNITPDNGIEVKSDIFNASIPSILELKEQIDAANPDASESDRYFALAQRLKDRFEFLKNVIFHARDVELAAGNEQKSIHTYLVGIANKLRAEEREKLKLEFPEYKPAAPKLTKSKAPSVKKLDKAELIKWANEVGMPLSVLQTVCMTKNMTPEQAANFLRKTEKETKSELGLDNGA